MTMKILCLLPMFLYLVTGDQQLESWELSDTIQMRTEPCSEGGASMPLDEAVRNDVGKPYPDMQTYQNFPILQHHYHHRFPVYQNPRNLNPVLRDNVTETVSHTTAAPPPSTSSSLSSPHYNPEAQPTERLKASSDAIPAVMVGVAGSIILFAIVLYITDVRDRCRHEQLLLQERNRDIDSHKQVETIGGSSGYLASYTTDSPNTVDVAYQGDVSYHGDVSTLHGQHQQCDIGEPSSLLPSITPSLPPVQNISMEHKDRKPNLLRENPISLASTTRTSLFGTSLLQADSEGLESSLEITELSESHRVSDNTDLSSLVDLSQVKAINPCCECQRYNVEERPSQTKNAVEHQNDDCNKERPDDEEGNQVFHAKDDDSNTQNNNSASLILPGSSDSVSDSSIATFLTDPSSRPMTCDHGPIPPLPSRRFSECLRTSIFPVQAQIQPRRSLADSSLSGEFSHNEESSRCDENGAEDSSFNTETRNVKLPNEGRVQNYEMSEMTLQQERVNDIGKIPSTVIVVVADNGDENDADQDFVRSIYFVPVMTATALTTSQKLQAQSMSLGIDLENGSFPATHPTVSRVHDNSPLAGRIFVGDIVLAVNDRSVKGLSGMQVFKSFLDESIQEEESLRAPIVKLTVMSSQSERSNSYECRSNYGQEMILGIEPVFEV